MFHTTTDVSYADWAPHLAGGDAGVVDESRVAGCDDLLAALSKYLAYQDLIYTLLDSPDADEVRAGMQMDHETVQVLLGLRNLFMPQRLHFSSSAEKCTPRPTCKERSKNTGEILKLINGENGNLGKKSFAEIRALLGYLTDRFDSISTQQSMQQQQEEQEGFTTPASLPVAGAKSDEEPTGNDIIMHFPINGEPTSKKQKRPAFDFTQYHAHQVALHVIYLGWNMNGLAMQTPEVGMVDKSVERKLFDALTTTKLIDSASKSNNYSRCGRTDKGVSAFAQVLSIKLRGNRISAGDVAGEISLPDYATMLNAVLGKSDRNSSDSKSDGESVRIAGYCPVNSVPRPFSARFDCCHRTYRYYFVKTSALNIEAMQKAATFLIGEHDFRNLCKLDYNFSPKTMLSNEDVDSVSTRKVHKPTIRTINSAVIKFADEDDKNSSHAVMFVEINGSAFLWHQIRCIMSVLFLVGLNREPPTVIRNLLHLPDKPPYCPASAFPLVLWNCQYPVGTFDEKTDDTSESLPVGDSALRTLLCDMYKLYIEHVVKAAMIKSMTEKLSASKKSSKNDEVLRRAADDGFVKAFMPFESNSLLGEKNKYVLLLKRK